MKYIVIEKDGLGHIIRFPNSEKMLHKYMAEAVQWIEVDLQDGESDCEFIGCEVVAGGFTTASGHCHGRSESLDVDSRPEDAQLLRTHMKYLAFRNNDFEFIVTFPDTEKMSHKGMAEVIKRLRVDTSFYNWEREFLGSEIVGAGFVTASGHCHGRSESLNIDSRPEDSALLASQFA